MVLTQSICYAGLVTRSNVHTKDQIEVCSARRILGYM